MDFDTQILAWVAIGVAFAGIAWAIFWPVEPSAGIRPISTHWDLIYVDDDGVMQFTMVRVLKINPTSRRMTAWCASSGGERVFRLSKIVKATDARSGARINIARLIDMPRTAVDGAEKSSRADKVEADAKAAGSIKADRSWRRQKARHAEMPAAEAVPSDVGSWWSTSRLGLH